MEHQGGTGMKDSIPTLQSLIKQKIHQKKLSFPDLVSAIGYTNITKGNRRLDDFLNTLEAPSEEFINNLLSVLDIDALSFNKSINTSLDQFNSQAKKKFTPHIQIILGIEVRPLFAFQMVKNKCSIPVPTKLQNQPLSDELEAIISLYKNHVTTVLSENISKHVIGFKYHREHNYYMKFDANLMMEDIVFVHPLPSGKILLGNRMVDLFSGGMV